MKQDLDALNGEHDKERQEIAQMKYENCYQIYIIRLVAACQFLGKTTQTITTLTKQIFKYYDLYDDIHCFLMKFMDDIDIGHLTSIIYQLIKKNTYKRNEDVLYLYRKKVHQNLNHITSGHLQKVLFIISRSSFPFQEILYRDLFY